MQNPDYRNITGAAINYKSVLIPKDERFLP